LVTKSRVYQPLSWTSSQGINNSGNPIANYPVDVVSNGVQDTITVDTFWPRLQFYKRVAHKLFDGKLDDFYASILVNGDVGSSFWTRKRWSVGNPMVINQPAAGVGLNYWVRGPVFPVDPVSNSNWTDSPVTADLLINLGTTAIARTSPVAPSASLATFLGSLFTEALPGIPLLKVWKDSTNLFRSYGDEYLNIQFGWYPFLSDIKKIVTSVVKATDILNQYVRDEGKIVRRRYSFPTTHTLTETTTANKQPYPAGLSTLGYETNAYRGTLTKTVDVTASYSFSGAYEYKIPLAKDSLFGLTRAASELNKLFGFKLTPDVMWQITPWTWLADWIGNMGDVMSNISNFGHNGLVLKYGYMMGHSLTTTTYRLDGIRYKQVPYQGPLTYTFISEEKRRVRATPYGFGLNIDDFSDQQWAILIALGLARSKGKIG
jgi:hypothetical protein